jgi:hypothetical protein
MRQTVAERAIPDGKGDCRRRVAPLALGSANARGGKPDHALVVAIECNGHCHWWRRRGRRSRCRASTYHDDQYDIGELCQAGTHCHSPWPWAHNIVTLPFSDPEIGSHHRPERVPLLCEVGKRQPLGGPRTSGCESSFPAGRPDHSGCPITPNDLARCPAPSRCASASPPTADPRRWRRWRARYPGGYGPKPR